ncbi:MAG TPA: tetratricopeptide repeat protein, partial [Vicinamibacterales bacterium]|nr:tetratricopeptide repeat protein [Vicinamibacterales bacterium]
MLNAVVAALLCALASQGSPYGEAERLAREGRTAEAIAAFERILERNPADNDARMWIARLELRMGH